MDQGEQAVRVQLKVVHDARFAVLLGVATTLCFAASALVPRAATTSPLEWFAIIVATAIVALSLLTRTKDWGDQPLHVFAQGLQIGTLFKDLRAPELRNCATQINGAQLRGRFVTLELRTHAADAARLHEGLARLGVQPESEKIKRAKRLILMFVPLGALLLILTQEFLLTADAARAVGDALPLVALLLSGSGLIAQGVDLVRLKRAGCRI